MMISGFFVLTMTFAMIIFQNCSSGSGAGGGTGGSSSVVSGVAVAGAPIIGTVTIKDSSTPAVTKFAVIEANGNYSIDVKGLTAPFMLRADGTVGGRSYSIYSAAALADINGTINVTPLTDLIVANIAGQLASTFFTAGNFSNVTPAELDAQAAALKARLLPILTAVGVSGSIDLLRTSFAADHTGLDAALDILRVDIDPNTAIATITSIINNQVITDNLASQADATVINGTGVAAGLSDVQLILGVFTTFTNLFATSLPAGGATNATLLALYDPTFLLDGENRSVFLSNIATDPTMIGLKFTNVSLVQGSLLPATGSPTSASVSFKVIQGGTPHDDIIFNLIKTGSVWTITGNGRIGNAKASVFARLQDTPSPNSIDSGLQFSIQNNGGSTFDYAIVSGPGLPAHTLTTTTGGVLFFNKPGNSFGAAAIGTAYNGSSTTPINSYGHNQVPLNNTQIGLIPDNSVYTIELFEDGGTMATGNDTVVATYTSAIGRRPYLSTELAVASFAPISAPTKQALFTFGSAGGTSTVSWSIPSGLFADRLHYFRSGIGSGANFDTLTVNLLSIATSGNITMTATDPAGTAFGALQASGVNLYMKDAFGRELCTIYNGAP